MLVAIETQLHLRRTRELAWRLNSLANALGPGPWLNAVIGRLMAASGQEPPDRPWYMAANEYTEIQVAYRRELGRTRPEYATPAVGFMNRAQRRHRVGLRAVLDTPSHIALITLRLRQARQRKLEKRRPHDGEDLGGEG